VVASLSSWGNGVSAVPGVPAVLIRYSPHTHAVAVVLVMPISMSSRRLVADPTRAIAGRVADPAPVIKPPAVTIFADINAPQR
jgi:hypothetical protein